MKGAGRLEEMEHSSLERQNALQSAGIFGFYPDHKQPTGAEPPLMFATAPTLRTSSAAGSTVEEPEPKHRRLSFSRASSSSVESTSSLVHTPTEDPQNELMKIALNSLQYPVERAAQHVREDEESPLGEKSRQVFGMSWLLRNCGKQKDSNVPRNHIYAAYVAACAELNLRPLNHASFGKLVRTCFPDIRTRRLGVRGKSKYHYCGVMLLVPTPEPRLAHEPAKIVQAPPHEPRPSAALEPADPIASPALALPGQHLGLFPNAELPELANFVGDADPVAVTTLQSLCTSHYRQISELFRTFNVKKYLSVSAGFCMSLAVPIQRLLLTPGAVAWVQSCDRTLYRTFVYHCGQLAVTPMLPAVADALRALATQLPAALDLCKRVPGDVVASQALGRVKVEEAQKFADILDRLLRVSESAHTALNVLTSEEVVAMKHDWEMAVTPAAARDAPCGRELATQMLGNDIPSLLSLRSDNPLENWARWLAGIKEHFSSIDPAILALRIGAVSTAALRDLNRAGCASFGAWWVLKCWVDDWMAWTAESSDFLGAAVSVSSAKTSLES